MRDYLNIISVYSNHVSCLCSSIIRLLRLSRSWRVFGTLRGWISLDCVSGVARVCVDRTEVVHDWLWCSLSCLCVISINSFRTPHVSPSRDIWRLIPFATPRLWCCCSRTLAPSEASDCLTGSFHKSLFSSCWSVLARFAHQTLAPCGSHFQSCFLASVKIDFKFKRVF